MEDVTFNMPSAQTFLNKLSNLLGAENWAVVRT